MSMMPHDRRSTSRIEIGQLVIHSLPEHETESRYRGMAVTLDLNEFGMRIQCADELTVGARFRFNLALGEEIVSATGRVVHLTRALNETFEMGVEFLDISNRDIELIRRYAQSRKPV